MKDLTGKTYTFSNPQTKLTLYDNYISLNRENFDITISRELRGETQVWYRDITEIKFEKPGFAKSGTMQFTSVRTGPKQKSLLGNEIELDQPQNMIRFKKNQLADAEEIRDFVTSRIQK